MKKTKTPKTLGQIAYEAALETGNVHGLGPWNKAPIIVREVHEKMARAVSDAIALDDRHATGFAAASLRRMKALADLDEARFKLMRMTTKVAPAPKPKITKDHQKRLNQLYKIWMNPARVIISWKDREELAWAGMIPKI